MPEVADLVDRAQGYRAGTPSENITAMVRPALVAASLALLAPAVAAAAPTKQACVASYEQGQKLRAEGKLSAARSEFAVCAESTCPDLTKTDCATWLTEVDASLPTVTFFVTDPSGKDVSDVKVTVDGAVVAERLDGKSVALDPGPRKLRFERAGELAIDVEVVVREGEKNRRIEARFGAATTQERPSGVAAVSPAAWALGASGLVGVAIFGVLGGVALQEKSDADESCAPDCTDDVVDSIRTKLIAADVALSVGLAALGAGVAIGIATGLSGGDAKKPDAALFLAPSPSGVFGGFSAKF
ncbi:MAG: hypothetical protein IPG04_04420 [Polyangiaceae bacterium]|nr:hypothetical protein [Polyangiaceae bacterium]